MRDEEVKGEFMNNGYFLNPKSSMMKFAAAQSDFYIDKTGLLSFLNAKISKEKRYICVSRPRRFGKSMAANMIACYYESGVDSKDLFSSMAISQDPSFEKHLNSYNVIFINMKRFLIESVPEMIKKVSDKLDGELREAFSHLSIPQRINMLDELLDYIYVKTSVPFIFVIDEWDCVMREREDRKSHSQYLDFLNVLLKDQAYVGLAYMTGILPVKKYNSESALNMFKEYSMLQPLQLAEFVGLTEDEVKKACEQLLMSFDEIKKWYDGYKFGDLHIFSPMSVSNALEDRFIGNYWTQSGTYESLKAYICMDFDGIKETVVQMLESPNYTKTINSTRFQNDAHTFTTADDVFTLLVHLGYLGYNYITNEIFIPNKEVESIFRDSIHDPVWSGLIDVHSISKELLDNVWNFNAGRVADAVEKIHQKIISIENYSSEEALSNVISWAFIHANAYYTLFSELESGKGYIDKLYAPKPQFISKPALLIELKWNKSAKSAINQILDKDYPDKVKELTAKKMLLVGINYSTRTKKHTCKIQEIDIDSI
jgi:hypothetical protein